jgi:hypothetical protein
MHTDADTAKVLPTDKARRVASDIAKMTEPLHTSGE